MLKCRLYGSGVLCGTRGRKLSILIDGRVSRALTHHRHHHPLALQPIIARRFYGILQCDSPSCFCTTRGASRGDDDTYLQ